MSIHQTAAQAKRSRTKQHLVDHTKMRLAREDMLRNQREAELAVNELSMRDKPADNPADNPSAWSLFGAAIVVACLAAFWAVNVVQ